MTAHKYNHSRRTNIEKWKTHIRNCAIKVPSIPKRLSQGNFCSELILVEYADAQNSMGKIRELGVPGDVLNWEMGKFDLISRQSFEGFSKFKVEASDWSSVIQVDVKETIRGIELT